MKVSRKSWHYKLRSLGSYQYSDTLCSYFWGVVGKILICILVLMFISVYCWILYLDITFRIFSMGVVITLLALFLSITSIDFYRSKFKYKYRYDPSLQNNILIDYIKAVKNKICPIIEFID